MDIFKDNGIRELTMNLLIPNQYLINYIQFEKYIKFLICSRCVCKCIEGYIGNPVDGCVPVPIKPPTKTDFPRPDLTVSNLPKTLKQS